MNKQKKQESEYLFAYHYLDLVEGFRLIEYLDYIRFVQRLVGDPKGKKILDAGCGDGRFCFEMKDADITGIDYSERAINLAKAFNPKKKMVVADLTKAPLKEKFDIIVSIETLEHIEPDKVKTVLTNIHKMLNPKGKLIITVPSKNIKVGSKHFQHFSKEDLEDYMKGLFAIEKIYGHGRVSWMKRKVFKMLLSVSYILEGLKIRIYKRFLTRYYQKNLRSCEISKAKRLIVVANKK